MYIDVVPNRNSPPAILLRESYRVDGKVKKRTLLNLTDWPPDLVEGFRALLKGGTALPPGQDAIVIKRSLPHGHVAAVLGMLRKIGLDRLLGPVGNAPNRCRDLVVAMIVARLIAPLSKLATAKALDPITAASSLGEVLGLGPVDEDELYTALDWLLERQPQVEAALARRHLKDGTLVLYDVSSSYLEGRCWPLAQFGFNRDGKRGKLQIVYGLLCAPDGCPVAIEVFEGSTGDPHHAGGSDRQAQAALRAQPRGARRRSRHDHPGTHRGGYQASRARLDHRAARPANPRPGRFRDLAALAVR